MKIGLFLAAGVAAALVTGLSGSAQAAQATSTAQAASLPQTFSVQSCTDNSFCLAVGTKPGHSFKPLVEEWNGKTWRIMSTPVNYSGDITCASATFCLANSFTYKGHTGGEFQWNGRTWRRFKAQPPNGSATCLTAKFCVGINNSLPPDGEAYWTGGKTWQNMPGADAGCGGAWCGITSFDCSSATICQDRGSYCNDSGCDNGTTNFSDFWNGVTWSSPDFDGPGFGGLQLAGRAFCMELDAPKAAAITNNWGQTWQSAKVNLATACHHLARCVNHNTLACSSAHFCMAFLDQVPAGALVWNGAKWGATKMPARSRPPAESDRPVLRQPDQLHGHRLLPDQSGRHAQAGRRALERQGVDGHPDRQDLRLTSTAALPPSSTRHPTARDSAVQSYARSRNSSAYCGW